MIYAVRGLNIMPDVVFLFDEEEAEKAEHVCNCLTDLHNFKYGMCYFKYQEAHRTGETFWDWLCDCDEIYADKYNDYNEVITDIKLEVMDYYNDLCESGNPTPFSIEISYHGEIRFISSVEGE